MLGFNITNNGVILDSEAQLRRARELSKKTAYSRLGELNTDPATPNGQEITAEAALINNMNQTLLWALNQLSPNTASGQGLDFICSILGIVRRPATATQLLVRCNGAPGTIIRGRLDSNPSKIQDATSQIFTATSNTTITPQGYANVTFSADNGAVESMGNFTISTIQAGWESIDISEPVITGMPAESDSALRNRYLSVFNQVGSGTTSNISAYINNNVPDVIYAVGDENSTGTNKTPFKYTIAPNTFVISVLGGKDADIAKVIYDRKSLANMQGNTAIPVIDPINNRTYMIMFLRPAAVPLSVQVNITESLTLPSDINNQINQICQNVFNTQFERIYTRYFSSKFQSALSSLQGINQVSVQLSIDGGDTWQDSVQYDLDQYANFGSIQININEE